MAPHDLSGQLIGDPEHKLSASFVGKSHAVFDELFEFIRVFRLLEFQVLTLFALQQFF